MNISKRYKNIKKIQIFLKVFFTPQNKQFFILYCGLK